MPRKSTPDHDYSAGDIRDEILRQLYQRDKTASICPSEVARSLFRHWREQMDLVRQVADEMAEDGLIVITQGTESVDIHTVKGPVRLRLPPPEPPA